MKICPFCDNPDVQSRVVVKNNLAFAFPTNIPITPGHMLVVPTRCVSTFDELTQKEIDAVLSLRKKIKEALIKAFNAEGFNYAWNEGVLAGQGVNHLHLHIVPRKEGDKGILGYDPRKFLYRPGSRVESPLEELDEIVKLVKSNLI